MEFQERKNPPFKLSLPGWPDEIDYKRLRQTFPLPIFVLAFGSAIQPPIEKVITTRFLIFNTTKKKKRYANDVDFLVVTSETTEPYELRNGVPYRYLVGDSYSFAWVDAEYPGAMHLQVAMLAHVESAIKARDTDVLRILSSCEIVEGDVTLARRLIAKSLINPQ